MFSAIRSLFASKMLLEATETTASTCPTYERMEDFDLTLYYGRWFEQVRDKSTFYEIGDDCVCANYSANDDGTTRVRNNNYNDKDGWTGGTITAFDVGVEGGIYVSWTGNEPPTGTQPNYNIIHTDYDNYTIVYDCGEFKGQTFENLWILSRTPVLSDEKLNEARSIIAEKLPSYDMSKKSHYTTQGDSCPYDDQPE